MKEELLKMPKVELHLHLDGSISVDLLSKLSGLSKDEVIRKTVSQNDVSLKDYLDRFNFVNRYLNTKEILEQVSCQLGKDLEKENVIYAEIRFAPLDYVNDKMTADDVIEAILRGLRKCHVKTNLILCMRRGMSIEENRKVVELANKYLSRGVVAVDLVGDEENYPFKDLEYLFKMCKYAQIPVTIHAGEITKRDIKDVIPYTKRIGHGIKIYDDIELMDLVKENNILLEVCPNSNIDTKNTVNYSSHPIRKLYDYGIKVCINTDNRTISDITLTEEYINLMNELDFSYADLVKMNLNAISGAFITNQEKLELEKIITK